MSTESTLEQMIAYAAADLSMKAVYPGLHKALKDLNSLVGMRSIKESVAEQVQYFLSLALANKRVSPALTRAMASARRTKKRRRKKHGWSRRKKTSTKKSSSKSGGSSDAIVRARIQDLTSAILETIGSEDSDDSDYECCEDSTPASIRPDFARSMNLHTLLLGAPGTGKTTLAKVLVSIWGALGLMKRDHYCIVTRGDLVAKYQGHSTAKIKKLMREYQNGVIFIDEAYNLVNDDKDTFGNEVMGEIVEGMTNPDNHVTFIMAGYEKAVKRTILGHNEGLERRFGAIHVVPKPSMNDLGDILHSMLRDGKWVAVSSKQEVGRLLRQHPNTFHFAGGDMEVLADLTKKAHIKRLWPDGLTHRIQLEDIQTAIGMFQRSKDRISPAHIEGLYS